MKDYYKILDVPSSATATEIKKAYRALAFRYHPDKNPGNQLSEAHFKEIQEAYSTLSDPVKKTVYDDERWLNGMGGKTTRQETVTPAWLEKVSRELTASLATMDTYRMSQKTLQAYILLILSDPHLNILLQQNEPEVNKTIITELLSATEKLEVKYLDEIRHRLLLLAGNNHELKQMINNDIEQRKRKAFYDQFLPYFIILVTIALCICMYYYGGKK